MTDDATQRPGTGHPKDEVDRLDRLDRRGSVPMPPRPATGPTAPGNSAFAARIEELLADCRRHKLAMTVVSVAIDSVHRDGGEDARDLESGVALEFGHRLRGRVRGSDHVLWVSDHEYGAALLDAGADGARAVHRRLIDSLGGRYRLGDQLAAVQLSLGFAVYPADGQHGAALVAAAIAGRLRA